MRRLVFLFLQSLLVFTSVTVMADRDVTRRALVAFVEFRSAPTRRNCLTCPSFQFTAKMGLMAGAGMAPYEILRSATKNVGEYFRDKDKFGTIMGGSRADLILLEKNPLKGVANIANPLGVMVRGRWLSQEHIREKLTAISQQPSGT